METRYIVLMGVSGCGKTTVAERVAVRLDWPFIEGDTLHPAANVAKMRRGEPLDDADRAPWLDAVARTISDWRSHGNPGVLTCSALKRAYRGRIADGHEDVLFVYLHGSRELLVKRLDGRDGHFMPSSLLDSQLATLEEPKMPLENALRLEIDRSPQALARGVVAHVTTGTAG